MTTAVLDAVVLDEARTFVSVAKQAGKTISSDYYFKTMASLKDWPQLSWAVEAPATPKPYVPKPPAVREFDLAMVYRKAAKLIEEKGWTQGISLRDNGSICTGAAIRLAAGYPAIGVGEPEASLYGPFVEWLSRGGEVASWLDSRRAVEAWNDDPIRTKAQVVSALRGFADSIPA